MIHAVWSTKNRLPFLKSSQFRSDIWKHIKETSHQKGIFIDTVNGYHDHCHCLISLCADQAIKKVIQLIKGESSHWINHNVQCQQYLTVAKFEWQDEYFAVSVSESNLEKVRKYIRNQEQHHQKRTSEEEYLQFIRRSGLGERIN